MAAPKFTRKNISVMDITVDFDQNVRLKDQYDIPQMCDGILAAGRIINPISVEELKDDNGKVVYKALRGNRRTIGGQTVYQDPATPAEVKAALGKMEVLVYKDLSEQERMALIVDHDQKSLSATEVVLTIWRLVKMMYTEKDIAVMCYFLLAKYTGNERKLNELPTNAADRAKKLTAWFHGTLGNYIMAVQRMPEYVREAFIMTHKLKDGIVKKDEVNLPVKVNQARVTLLSKAKTADTNTGMWNDVEGGPAFKAEWEKFRLEDAGILDKEKTVRPSNADLDRSVEVMRSDAIKKALRAAQGLKQADLGDVDERTYREQEVFKVLYEVSGNGGAKPEYKDLLALLIKGDLDVLKATLSATA